MKKFFEWIIKPGWIKFIISFILLAVSVTGVILFLTFIDMGTVYDIFAYMLFFFSAAALSYTVYLVIKLAPRAKAAAKNFALKHDFTKNLVEQYSFRTICFAVISFIVSAGNAFINGGMGIAYASTWFIALGVYYLLLALMRGAVLLFHRKKRKNQEMTEEQIKAREIRTYKICGIWLVLLPAALGASIWEMVMHNRAFVHSGLAIYYYAAYTTYKIVNSILNFIKARNGDDMTVRALRNVNLADAIVSVLALQTAMFHEFSPEENLGYANGIMGIIVCALTILLGVIMIVNSQRELKKLSAAEGESADSTQSR